MKAYKTSPMTGFHIPGHNRGCGINSEFINLVGADALQIDTTDEFYDKGIEVNINE